MTTPIEYVDVPGKSTLGWLAYEEGEPRLSKWGTDGRIVYQHFVANGRLSDVASFVPAVAIPADALHRLRNQQGRDGKGATTSQALADFLTDVDHANRSDR